VAHSGGWRNEAEPATFLGVPNILDPAQLADNSPQDSGKAFSPTAAILTTPLIDDLVKQGKIAAGPRTRATPPRPAARSAPAAQRV